MKSKLFFATVLMWLCLGPIVIMCFFPPWIGIAREDGHDDMRAPVGYHFVFRPPVWPTVSDSSDYLLIEHYENRIYFEKLGLQCIAALGIAAMMYYIKVNDKRSRIIDNANTMKYGIIDKANTMKFGIIAAVLVVLIVSVLYLSYIAPKIFPSLATYEIYPSSGMKPVSKVTPVVETITLMFFHIGPPIVFIISILGLIFDKHKYLAVLTMLLVIAWYIFLCWLLHAMREPPY